MISLTSDRNYFGKRGFTVNQSIIETVLFGIGDAKDRFLRFFGTTKLKMEGQSIERLPSVVIGQEAFQSITSCRNKNLPSTIEVCCELIVVVPIFSWHKSQIAASFPKKEIMRSFLIVLLLAVTVSGLRRNPAPSVPVKTSSSKLEEKAVKEVKRGKSTKNTSVVSIRLQ